MGAELFAGHSAGQRPRSNDVFTELVAIGKCWFKQRVQRLRQLALIWEELDASFLLDVVRTPLEVPRLTIATNLEAADHAQLGIGFEEFDAPLIRAGIAHQSIGIHPHQSLKGIIFGSAANGLR